MGDTAFLCPFQGSLLHLIGTRIIVDNLFINFFSILTSESLLWLAPKDCCVRSDLGAAVSCVMLKQIKFPSPTSEESKSSLLGAWQCSTRTKGE